MLQPFPTVPIADIVAALREAHDLCLQTGRQIRTFLYLNTTGERWFDVNPPCLKDNPVPPDEPGVHWWELPVIERYQTEAALQTLAQQWIDNQAALQTLAQQWVDN